MRKSTVVAARESTPYDVPDGSPDEYRMTNDERACDIVIHSSYFITHHSALSPPTKGRILPPILVWHWIAFGLLVIALLLGVS